MVSSLNELASWVIISLFLLSRTKEWESFVGNVLRSDILKLKQQKHNSHDNGPLCLVCTDWGQLVQACGYLSKH